MTRTRIAAASLAVVAALALSACSGPTAAQVAKDQFPDLSDKGFTTFECGEGKAIGASFQAPTSGDYKAECWTGAPDEDFTDVANAIQDEVMLATGGQSVTSEVCPEDSLTAAGGIACRAVLITKADTRVVMRTVVVLADPATVLTGLTDDSTQDEVREAIKGAEVEVLIGTEPNVQVAPSAG